MAHREGLAEDPERDPRIRLIIAGSNPTSAVVAASANPAVSLHANVNDLGSLYHEAQVAVVPLRVGSGSRIKILEAGSYSLPVVTTLRGAEGLSDALQREMFVSNDNPEHLARLCLAALGNPKEARARGTRLREVVVKFHDRDQTVSATAGLLRTIL